MTETTLVVPAPETTVDDRSDKPYSSGRFEKHLRDHLRSHSKKKWCSIECALHHFNTRVCDQSRKKMAQRFSKMYRTLLERGSFLLKRYGPHGDLQEVKIFNLASEEDRKFAYDEFERIRQKGRLSEDKLFHIAKIIGLLPAEISSQS